MAHITREELIKQAGILSSAGSLAKESIRAVDGLVGLAGRGVKKGLDVTTDVMHTANNGKVKAFEEAHLGMKQKTGGGLVGKMFYGGHNKKIEETRKAFRAKPMAEQKAQIRSMTGSESKANEYEKLVKKQKLTRGSLIAGAAGLVGANQYRKHQKRKAEQQAIDDYYRSQGY